MSMSASIRHGPVSWSRPCAPRPASGESMTISGGTRTPRPRSRRASSGAALVATLRLPATELSAKVLSAVCRSLTPVVKSTGAIRAVSTSGLICFSRARKNSDQRPVTSLRRTSWAPGTDRRTARLPRPRRAASPRTAQGRQPASARAAADGAPGAQGAPPRTARTTSTRTASIHTSPAGATVHHTECTRTGRGDLRRLGRPTLR
jgi:hypothetical protein